MEIKVVSKYEIGDEIFSLEEDYKSPICKKCNGTGVLELVVGGTVNCNNCYGSKVDSDIVTTFYKPTCKIKIDTIVVEIDESEINIVYWGKDEDGYDHTQGFLEKESYPTIELAELECQNRNKKVIVEQ